MAFSPVLVIGLDMGDGDLIRHWGKQGRLPQFAELLESGAWMELQSTAEVLHTSSWPTFATGTLPGRHGVYYPYQPKPGHQLARHIKPDQYGEPTFWNLADRAGAKCLVYDVPETFPESGFRGKAIFDWGTWAWYGTPSSLPFTLSKQLQSRFGAYPLGLEAKSLGLRMPDADRLEKGLLKSIRYKLETFAWLSKQEAWDLAVIGFCETHPAGHYFWPRDVKRVEEGDEDDFRPLFNVYAELDRAIGVLCKAVPLDTTLLIVSGDGVRPNYCAWHLLDRVLGQLGFSCSAAGRSQGTGGVAPRPSLPGRIKRLLPEGTKRWIADLLPWWVRNRVGSIIQASEVDWSRTFAFTLPTDLEGCIRINLKGREPQGIVEPGSQYKELCQQITERLKELINPATGKPAVRHVWLRNEIYPGKSQEALPDLVVTWNDEAPFTSLASPRFHSIEGRSPDRRTGTHSSKSFLLAAGSRIPKGNKTPGRLVDVAPTVLRLLGIDEDFHMDGKPLAAMAPQYLQK